MKRFAYNVLVVLSVIILIISVSQISHADQFKSNGTIDVYFSPHGATTRAVVNEIRDARTEILVQAYSFTSAPIAKALIDARKRGVHIEVILDKSNRSKKYSAADFMAHSGIPIYIDAAHAIAHNKIIIIDRGTLITGSFNFTKAAEDNNAENLLIIKGNKPLVGRYIQNYNDHREHSVVFEGRYASSPAYLGRRGL